MSALALSVTHLLPPGPSQDFPPRLLHMLIHPHSMAPEQQRALEDDWEDPLRKGPSKGRHVPLIKGGVDKM